jgi:hypothetical protein
MIGAQVRPDWKDRSQRESLTGVRSNPQDMAIIRI